jgi:hypothetical protein
MPVTTIDPARHKRIHLFRGHDHLTILVCAGLLPDWDGHKVPGYHNGWVSIPSETRCARSGSIHVLVFEDLPMPERPGDRSAEGTW